MPEPSSSGVAGLAGWKLLGGAAGIAAGGVTLAAVVVMLMTWPKTASELAVALISTVLSSLAGGAAVIIYFDLLRHVIGASDLHTYVALMAGLGIVFTCGLPGWLLVRAAFSWMERRRDKDLGELADDVRSAIGGRP
ncbi:hypothetical protein [Roseateles cavernae]|uniref:hypothetical protein n=1 Tax=Roseateles cavernae TaxID=3153578 RepID=UPI0032E3BCB4